MVEQDYPELHDPDPPGLLYRRTKKQQHPNYDHLIVCPFHQSLSLALTISSSSIQSVYAHVKIAPFALIMPKFRTFLGSFEDSQASHELTKKTQQCCNILATYNLNLLFWSTEQCLHVRLPTPLNMNSSTNYSVFEEPVDFFLF
jgi:hypothetical protein